MSTALNNLVDAILATIQTVGFVPFAIMVVINIILYRFHPVLGFLGTLFLFAWLVGLI